MKIYKTGNVTASKWSYPKNLSPDEEAKERFLSAESFRDCALLLYKRTCLESLDEETRVRLTFVAVTNQALGIEQALKSLLYTEQNRHFRGHDLKVLFDKLTQNAQKRITEFYDEHLKTDTYLIKQQKEFKKHGISSDLASALETGKLAFEKFRYSYDYSALNGYNLGPFAYAIHRYVYEIRPDWEVLNCDYSEVSYPHAFFGKRQG